VSTGAAAGTDTFYGAMEIPGYNKNGGVWLGGAAPISADLTIGALLTLGRPWRLNGGVKSLRLSGGTFDAGQAVLCGRQ
jgi:hypothetical protein